MTSPATASKPDAKPLRVRKCQWCGQQFETAHHSKEFCTPAHKTEFAELGGRSVRHVIYEIDRDSFARGPLSL